MLNSFRLNALVSSRHPTHQGVLATALGLLAVMALTVLLVRFFPVQWLGGPPEVMSVSLHTTLEIIAVVIASLVFAIGWASHQRQSSRSLLVFACLFLGVALLDFTHTMSYAGMPHFITPSGPEKAIIFWLSARLLATLALFWVTFSPWNVPHTGANRFTVLLLVLLVVAVVHLIVLRFPDLAPRTFSPETGLTAFKIWFEYALIGTHVFIAIGLWRAMQRPLPFNAAALFGAVGAMALSELCFTFYESVTDHLNLLGHLIKIASYLFLFKAIFVDTVEQPYTEMEASGKRLKAVFDALPDIVLELDSKGRVIQFHAPRAKRLPLSDKPMVGRDLAPLLPEAARALCERTFARARLNGHAQSEPFKLIIKDHLFWFQISAAPKASVGVEDDGHFVVIARDVTKSKEQESEILRLGQYDSLTGLPNRKLFHQRVDLALGLMERSGGSLALLFIDLDHFKNINDTLGHEIGDLMLKALADRLRTNLREEDTLSRQGGDEFIMALPGLDGVAAVHVAERILASIVRPVSFGEHISTTSASIGIAVYPEDGTNFDELSRHADAAMYQAKQDGRNTYRFFTHELQTRMSRMLALENSLRSANDNLELSLRYQPQWDLSTQQVTGMEALLRWNHPELGEVDANEFIPAAESSGQILALNDWVLNQALAQLKRWLDEGVAAAPVAVNLSLTEFRRGDLAKHISKCLQTWNVSPAYLQLEVTEAMLMVDPDSAVVQLQQLSALGVHIVIDDFGTCYSSLLQVKRFQAHTIKIDRSFIEGLESNPDKLTIVSSMISLAHELGLDTLAEGVETEEQLTLLRQHGCRFAQGFYLGRPLDPASMTTLLRGSAAPAAPQPDKPGLGA
ncbi:MAG TPA: EAL domain-containing protein [Pseudomonas xinjiangensis]|uniref:EAL domain-containing protein n=2 Tax=root TaxID=1 RepID=A0A7V1BPF3_9GAMM|nr:EAL domain-containing protein [Halopseudomonas xinjiangensis]HEC47337.1 EAL domain-containing protein [Halopseudomonas xinjiangensis]